MSAKGAPWQHPASAEQSQMYSPNRSSKFTVQEGLDNNWVFFPEPHFVNVDDDDEEDSSDEGHGHHDKSGNRRDSVGSDGEPRPGNLQRGDSWIGGWWGKVFKSKL